MSRGEKINKKMNIRILCKTDIICFQEDIYRFLCMCINPNADKVIDEVFIRKKIINLKYYIDKNMAYVYAAFDKDDMVGFLWGYPIVTPVSEDFHIAYIAVKSDFRGKGIGGKLIKTAENTSKELGIENTELIVDVNNITAMNFYIDNGYEVKRNVLRKKIR